MIKLKDSYYYEYEICNHNLLISKNPKSGEYGFTLINQLLPILYRNEYINYCMNEIYEEDEFECND